ncbi:transcriptional regulator [Herminiimonas sp. KBW02]|uniref:LysR family transcriptional regulator n=1 Tax=Herminiimonas sp. KBW02 TaxID=2153363 RepID=UPI000F5B0ED1|nr:LysR family transcriptional regulator [Herminiimonas sp. KBW02]RQO34029.1 transcriptional regulator [Herminiimonas sp. KBW02]
MDRLDELEVFIAILDSGSLIAASRKLRRSPPAITRALGSLEERVGTRLFERTTRRLVATEAGSRLAQHARRVLADYEETVQEDASAPLRGVLRVTAPVVFGRRHIAPIVNSYLDQYPEMRVELVTNDRNLDLIEEGIDVGVRIGTLADTSMVARRVGQVQSLLVASPDYIARKGKPESIADIAAHDVIFTAIREKAPEWRFRHNGREHIVALAPRLIVNEIDAVLLAAKAGRGLARVLSYQVADELRAGTLLRVLPEIESPMLPVQLIVPSARLLAAKSRAFLDLAISKLGTLNVIQTS